MSALPTSRGTLWVRSFGPPPVQVVALHGFTLHGGMFAELADHLGTGLAAPDLPGHGRSEIDPITAAAAVAAVLELLTELEKPLLLGYSQGARIALQVALNRPDLIKSLVLASGAPGLSGQARELRRVADDRLATEIETLGLERFIDRWLAQPMIATAAVSAARRTADRKIRLENTSAGLAAALRGMGQASVPDSSDRLASLQMPVAFIAGQSDGKYRELAGRMAKACGVKPTLVGNSGHNVMLEAPEEVAKTVTALLGR